MTVVRPFRALRYRRSDLTALLVPPYDVVEPEQRTCYYERDPHNAIRLELTRAVRDEADTEYSALAATLAAWRRAGVLVRDKRPALYGLRQRFTARDGRSLAREGFFAALHLEDYERRVVRPHERTLAEPKVDRLKLLRATRANLSIVFLLYEDRAGAVGEALAPAFAAEPLARAEGFDGVDHALFRLDDPHALASVERALAERPVVIADGHHRYETALQYRDERRAAGEGGGDPQAEWTLAYFANAYAPGSLLLPIHRVIRKGPVPTAAAWCERLPGWRIEESRCPDPEQLPGWLAGHLAPLAGRHAFASLDGSGTLRLFSREGDGELAIRALHREVVAGVFGLDEAAVRDGAVAYHGDPARAARDVRAGRGTVALFLNPLLPEDVFRVTAAGELLPQKSTFFHPKLPTGLVFRALDGEEA